MRKRIIIWYLKKYGHWEFDFDDGEFRFVMNKNSKEYYSLGMNETRWTISDEMFENIIVILLGFPNGANVRRCFLDHELK